MPVIEHRLASSALVGLSYDQDSQELALMFTNGQERTFSGVPPDVVDGLLKAPSPGRYYNQRIRGMY